jgi:CO dehydrogenase maturation factor
LSFSLLDNPDHNSAHRAASLKIAIAGKGGVGKTTVAAALARALANRNFKVLAIDADPDANLASGLPLDAPEAPSPLATQRERLKATARQNGSLPAGVFLLNPVLDDIDIPTVSWGHRHRLVVLGWTARGGQGCYCDENAVLRSVLNRLIAEPGEAIVVDGEPGLEHLSRGTLASADVLLAVLDPGARSVRTAQTIRSLAVDLGIPYCLPVLSGVRSKDEASKLEIRLGDWPLFGSLPFDPAIAEADLNGRPPVFGPAFGAEIESMVDKLLALARRQHDPVRFAPRPHTHIGPDGKPYVHAHAIDPTHTHEH